MDIQEVKKYLEDNGAKFIHIGIICDDIETTIATLETFPFIGKFTRSTASFESKHLEVGAPYVINLAFADLVGHDFVMEILQPVVEKSDPSNIYSLLLEKYGNGLSHIAYSVPSMEVFNTALSVFKNNGYRVILKGQVQPNTMEAIPKGNAFVYLEPINGSNVFFELLLPSIS